MRSATGRRVSGVSTFPGDNAVGDKRRVKAAGRELSLEHEAWTDGYIPLSPCPCLEETC